MKAAAQLLVDVKKLHHNYTALRAKLNPSTKLIAVVKANAYGNSANTLAKSLEDFGADMLAVAYAQEGVALRKAGISIPIMVFYPQAENLKELTEHQLEPVLYNLHTLHTWLEVCNEIKQKDNPVHLKFNTGLNRIGFSEKDFETLEKHCSLLNVKSIYSHLSASENPKPCRYTNKQIEKFKTIEHWGKTVFASPPMFHLLNTSGVFNYPELQRDAVRVGIGLYGFANQAEWDKELLPISELSSRLCQLHSVKKGESVGYNQGWIAPRDSRIGVIPIGHADGIGRQFGKETTPVWINGEKALIVGNVCMDLLMIDVTDISCSIGDRVILFGAEHTANDFATAGATLSYELLCGLGPRIAVDFV